MSTAALDTLSVGDTELSVTRTATDAYTLLKPLAEALGLDADSQAQKLRGRSWAVTTKIAGTGADGKTYQMLGLDRRTLTMYLATLNENRVSDEVRPALVALQAEAADALDAYWHDGGAINPRATEDQLDVLTRRAKDQMELISLARGVIDGRWLETQARHVLAAGLGREPEVEASARHLTVSDFLAEQGVKGRALANLAPGFGKAVKAEYLRSHGSEPGVAVRLIDGVERNVCAYTVLDRPIMARAWDRITDSAAVTA